jgi:hypothetical protein
MPVMQPNLEKNLKRKEGLGKALPLASRGGAAYLYVCSFVRQSCAYALLPICNEMHVLNTAQIIFPGQETTIFFHFSTADEDNEVANNQWLKIR